MKRLVLSAALAVGSALVACQKAEQAEQPQTAIARLSPEQAADARRTITLWLECDECTEGQLDSVVHLGAIAIPTLAAVLNEGLSPAKQELTRRQLTRSYRELRDYEKTHPKAPVTMSEEQFVATFLGNEDALHRIRAATALRAIGGPDARRALEQAPTGLRPDVQAVVRAALDSLK